MASLLRQVGRAYRRHPVICNVGLYGSLYFLGDLSQQTICRCPERNFQSARQVACVGAGVFGPFYYYWYRYLDGKVPGNAAKAVVKKMVLDQMVAGAGCVYIFYVGRSSFYMIFVIRDRQLLIGRPLRRSHFLCSYNQITVKHTYYVSN